MRTRKPNLIRLLILAVLVVLATASVGCDVTYGVGVSYGYPGWGGPCCYGGYGGGWGGYGYRGRPVW